MQLLSGHELMQGSLSLSLHAGKGRCTGLRGLLSALLGQGRLRFQLAFWQLLAPAGTLHEEQAVTVPQSSASCQTHPGLKRFEISSGGRGSSFVSLHVTHKVMGLLVMARKLSFDACDSNTLLISSLCSS